MLLRLKCMLIYINLPCFVRVRLTKCSVSLSILNWISSKSRKRSLNTFLEEFPTTIKLGNYLAQVFKDDSGNSYNNVWLYFFILAQFHPLDCTRCLCFIQSLIIGRAAAFVGTAVSKTFVFLCLCPIRLQFSLFQCVH